MRNFVRLGVLAVVGAAALGIATPSFAAAGGAVARYQVTTYTITSSIFGTANHNYTASDNPCAPGGAGSFAGTGAGSDANAGVTETITGSLVGNQLSYHGIYTAVPSGFSVAPGYYYDVVATVGSGGSYTGTATDSVGGTYPITGTITSTATSYANHGQYVSSAGGGADAAHSCIGQPVHG